MDPNDMCESFLVADRLINGEKAFTTIEELRKQPKFYEHCPHRRCVTDIDNIAALSTYVFLKLNAHKNNEIGEYFLMWLSDKLFKIHMQKKTKKKNPITLEMAYKMYLEKDMGNFRYWNLLGNINGLKNANLRHMNEFYKLLNHICKIVIYYKIKGSEPMTPLQNSTNSFNQYMLLYQNVSKCNSYLHLLDNLKKKYNNFRTMIKNADSNLANSLQTLTTIEHIDSYFAENFTKFDFSDPKCKLQYDKNILTKYEKAKAQKKQKDSGSNGDSNNQSSQPQSLVDQTPNPPAGTGSSPSTPNNGDDTTGSNDKVVDGVQSQENTKGSEQTDPGGGKKNTGSGAGGGIGYTSDGKGGKDNKKVVSNSDAGDKSSGVSDGSVSVQGDQGAADTQVGDTGSGARSINSVAGDGSGSGQGSTDTTKGGASNGQDGSPGTGTNGGSGGTGGGINDQRGSGNQANTGSEQKPSGDQVPTHSSGVSSGYWSNWGGINLNITSHLPSFSNIYETQRKILTSASNKISDAYNGAMSIAKDTYDKTLTTVQGAYNATTNYVGGVVNSVTDKLNSFSTFSQLGDGQSGSDGSGNSLPTDNNPSSTMQFPNPDSNSPSSPPSSSIQHSQSSSVTSPPLKTSSQPKSNQAQNSPQPPSPPNQRSFPHVSQDTLQSGASNIVQQPDPNDGKGVQRMTITKATLPSSSTGPSNTENGNTNGTAVKMNEKLSIWCIGPNHKCDVTGIIIIIISISIILTIIYKYLSLGWTSKSKRKKSIKKVINSIGGKRPVQIIIKSYDRNKDLKPVINSARRKKDPLLNIYKLMQADPIPFINLFFLLIFFVYKRKENFLEL
ncbi:hypothetical protein YYE_00002 [Plasmodium vinckei vinckei]|nr:hypothetical protein YYE_00002 [Plasmodium vinckei vinckei]